MSFSTMFKNHLAKYLAMATVVALLGGGVIWYLDHKKHQAVAKIETTVQTVKKKAVVLKDKFDDKVDDTKDKVRKWFRKDTAQD